MTGHSAGQQRSRRRKVASARARRCPWPAERRRALAGLVLSLILIVGAVYLYFWPAYYTPASVGTVPAVSAAVARPVAVPPATVPPAAGSPPIRLQMPALGISAPVVPEGLVTRVGNPLDGPAGSLRIPSNPRTLGWWQYGAAPGSSQGTVVVAGHVDTAAAGAGALFHLAAAVPGQRITITTAAGTLAYQVVARHTYAKAALPASVFDRAGRPRLAVITCGGPFNWSTHHYADNIVIYALPGRG